MSKSKSHKDALGTTDTSPPGTAVDFLFRTMSELNLLCRILASTHRVYADCIKYCLEFFTVEREGAPGKRKIRPKNVDELLQADIQELGSDEDPDFDVSFDKHHNESDVSINSDEDGDSSNPTETSGGRRERGRNHPMGIHDLDDDSDDEDDHSYNGED
jgi:hypothetical protein